MFSYIFLDNADKINYFILIDKFPYWCCNKCINQEDINFQQNVKKGLNYKIISIKISIKINKAKNNHLEININKFIQSMMKHKV